MPPKLALFTYFLFIVYLFKKAKDGGWSKGLWIPVIWIVIIGSKTPALWLAILTGSGRAPEGSLLDTAILIILLFAGFRILSKRGTDWHAVIGCNKWIFMYFAYIAITILWVDQPFRSLKLWVKDAGNLIMVLVVLTGEYSGEAVRSVLLRSIYILIPLSVVIVKYFPEIGRTYDAWTYQQIVVGASESKNALGAMLILCALGLFWNFFDSETGKLKERWTNVGHVLILLMTLWLLYRSNCATASGCIIIGLVLFLILRVRGIRNLTRNLGLSVFIVVPLLAVLLHFLLDAGELFVGTLGRDLTLTARTKIWEAVLNTDLNPLTGAGYANFWTLNRARGISEKLGFHFNLQEAHNGYIEIYLNSGMIGLILLLGAFAVGTARILRQLENGTFETVRFVCVVVALLYNVTESAFAGLNLIWFSLLLMLVEYPARRLPPSDDSRESHQRANEGARWRADSPVAVAPGY